MTEPGFELYFSDVVTDPNPLHHTTSLCACPYCSLLSRKTLTLEQLRLIPSSPAAICIFTCTSNSPGTAYHCLAHRTLCLSTHLSKLSTCPCALSIWTQDAVAGATSAHSFGAFWIPGDLLNYVLLSAWPLLHPGSNVTTPPKPNFPPQPDKGRSWEHRRPTG